MDRPALVLALTLALCAMAFGGVMNAAAADSNLQRAGWGELRGKLFGERSISEGSGQVIQLEVPLRPDNAATVPISVRSVITQSPDRYVKLIFIVVDNNPEPLVAALTLTPESGLADLATNIRVEAHSPVRAIAEMNTGELFMSSKLVKAAGGCAAVSGEVSASPSPDLGQILIRTQNGSDLGRPNWMRLIITHPNHTGLQVDPVKGDPIPAHFVKNITVSYGERTILKAETGISISEDPSFRFFYIPRGPGVIKVEIKDSTGLTFTKSLEITPN